MTRKQAVYEFLRKMKNQRGMDAVYTTEEIAVVIDASRANVSSDLNQLFREEMVEKLPGWPVRYRASAAVLTPMPEKSSDVKMSNADSVFEGFIGYNGSMGLEIEKAKAAVLYPLSGLPFLIGGKTGVGKTTFAKLMYKYAKKAGRIKPDAHFVSFNCADYANNPQLLMAQIFGYAKGAYTGADNEHDGLVARADGGVLFLDEVHRLPEAGQEMLFFLMDFGQYHRLGEANVTLTSRPIIIMATTEEPDSVLLAAFNRRIPISVILPPLDQRSPLERLRLIQHIFTQEARKLGMGLNADAMAIKALLSYDCPGNIGQLENDIRVACASAYVTCLMGNKQTLDVSISSFPLRVKDGLRKLRKVYSDVNLIAGNFEVGITDGIKDADTALLHSATDDIYEILSCRYHEFSAISGDEEYMELMMRLEIDEYFHKLIRGQDNTEGALQNNISQMAFDITHMAEEIIECELGLNLNERSHIAMAQHIEAAISRDTAGDAVYLSYSRLRKEHPDIFDTASQIVTLMQQDYGLDVPDDEIGILTNLILSLSNSGANSERCGILVACHGLGSAKTMARFANDIMGRDYVKWLDVTGQESPEELVLSVKSGLLELSCYESILVLTDSEKIIDICTTQKVDTNQDLYAICNISTSMVIEATLLAIEHKAGAQLIYHHLKTLAQGYNELYEIETKKLIAQSKKRLIVTACISGMGAAEKLKSIILSRFDIPENVKISTVDMGSVEALKAKIAELASTGEIICVIGMDVGLEINFPFISAVEFVLGNGVQRLKDILDSYNIKINSTDTRELTDGTFKDMFRSGKFLEDYLFYLSAEKSAPRLQECIDRIEAARGELRFNKRIMLLIHMCSMLERLIFETPNTVPPESAASDIKEACEPLEAIYNVLISDDEYEMLERILALELK